MNRWKFGVVGAGAIAELHALAVKDMENATLEAVCDIEYSRAEEFAKKHNCKAFNSAERMFDEASIDIATIATPSGLHLESILAAANKGIHTLCEKPLEVTCQRVQKAISAHKKAGTYLGCIFQTRYARALDPLRDAVKKGRFGQITFAGVYVPWWRTEEYYKNSWHGTWKLDGGGALMNQSIHMIDTLCELMPDIEAVKGFTSSLGHPEMEAEATATAALKFENGALGIVYGSTAAYPGQPKRLEVMGTKGTVIYVEDSYTVFDFQDKKPEDKKILQEFGQMDYKSGFSDPKAIVHDLHTVCFTDFISSIEEGVEFKINGEEALKAVRLIEAIYESSKSREIDKI